MKINHQNCYFLNNSNSIIPDNIGFGYQYITITKLIDIE